MKIADVIKSNLKALDVLYLIIKNKSQIKLKAYVQITPSLKQDGGLFVGDMLYDIDKKIHYEGNDINYNNFILYEEIFYYDYEFSIFIKINKDYTVEFYMCNCKIPISLLNSYDLVTDMKYGVRYLEKTFDFYKITPAEIITIKSQLPF